MQHHAFTSRGMRTWRAAVAAVLVVTLAAPAVHAQPPNNFTWNNSSTDWATTTSWTPTGTPSTANDFANFGSLGTTVLNPDLGATSQTVGGLTMDMNPLGGGYTLTASGGGTLTLSNPNTAAFQTIPGAMTFRGTTHTLSNVSVTISAAPFNTAIEIASSGTLVLGSGAAINVTLAAGFAEIRGSGATLVMDGSGAGPTPTLTQAGQNIRANGGGTFVFLGNVAGSSFSVPTISSGPGDDNIIVNQPGAAGVTVTVGQATSAAGVSLGRFSSAGTYFVSATGTGTLGGGAGNPTVLSLTAPFTNNGVIVSASGGSAPYVFATTSAGGATTGTFANYDSTNGVVAAMTTPRNTAQFIDTVVSPPAATENTNFQPDQATTTLTAPVTVNTLTINPSATNQVLNLNGNDLTMNGLVLSGNRGFAITAGSPVAGQLFGTGTAIREIAVVDPAATLTTDASLAGANAPVNKAGPGTLILNNTTTDQLAFATAQRVNITGGTLRVPAAFMNGTGNILAFRGGVLEVDGGGVANSFTRSLGSAAGNVNWRGTATSFADNGSGGFSAVNGNLAVAIGGTASPTPLIWGDSNTINGSPGDTSFFAIGSNSLLFGSAASSSTVRWFNPLALDNGTANLPAQNREIRVMLGTGVPNDRTQIDSTAPITGSAATDLLKTGTGVLELLGANTYAGNTLVKGGSLRLSNGTTGSATGTGAVLVFAGATLSGTGTAVSGSGVTIAGTISPGDPVATIGTLTFGAVGAPTSVTIGGSGVYRADIGTLTSSDQLAVNGPLTLGSGSTLTIAGSADGTPYTLATYTTLAGTFTTVNNLPAGYMVNYGTGVNSTILLVPVPEPGHVLLACGLVTSGLTWWKRRRGTN